MIREISDKNVDVDRFVQLAIADAGIRDEIVRQLLTNPHIMVYYHCYYVVSKAIEERPDLFYPYWHELTPLLSHPNSYHRDIALTILANLSGVDRENLFSKVYPDYFEHINDQKFMTAQCCVRSSLKILRNQPGFKDPILALLLDVDRRCAYPEKQKELLKYDVLDILDIVYEGVGDKKRANEFIKACLSSISPKTKRKAKEMVGKYSL